MIDGLGSLQLVPVAQRPDLLADPVRAALVDAAEFAAGCGVAPIDPALSDTAAFCAAYDVPMATSANCVIVSGRRAGEERWAAAVLLATTRLDVNGVLRRRLDVRKLSFAGTDDAVARTGMEYGGITPIGLPAGWPVLIDARVVQAGPVIIGAGLRAAKIAVDGAALASLPHAEVITDLAG